MNFKDVVLECATNQEFVVQFNRLYNCSLVNSITYDNRSNLVKMIDKETGYQKLLDEKMASEYKQFIEFVFEYIWTPILLEYERNVKT